MSANVTALLVAEATWAPQGRPGATPPGADWETIELRSDLARHLDRTAFPGASASSSVPPLVASGCA